MTLEALKKQNKIKVRLELTTTLGQIRGFLSQTVESWRRTNSSISSWKKLEKKNTSSLSKKEIRSIIKTLEGVLVERATLRDQLIEAVNKTVEKGKSKRD